MTSDNNNIEKLFQSKFESFEADVNPKLWENIQQGIGQSTPTPSSGGQGSGLLGGKLGAVAAYTGAVIISAATIYGIWKYNDNRTNQQQAQQNNVEVNNDKNNQKEQELVVNSEESTPKVEGVDHSVQLKNKEEVLPETNVPDEINTKSSSIEETSYTPEETKEEPTNNSFSTEKAEQAADIDNNPNEDTKKIADKLIKDAAVEPSASIYASPVSGYGPLEVNLSNYGYAASSKWEMSDGTTLEGVNVSHTFSEPGTYTIKLTAINKQGHEDTDEISIEVIENGVDHGAASSIDFIPNVISPNNDGYNDAFTIKSKNLDKLYLEVYNQKGKLIHKNEGEVNWSGEGLQGTPVAEGRYYYIIQAIGTDGKKYLEKGVLTVTR